MKLGFIGAGAMAEAMIAGVLRNKVASPSDIVASDVVEARRRDLQTGYGIRTVADNIEAAQGAEIVVLAIKPQNLAEVMAGLKGRLAGEQAALSIVAGAPIKKISSGLGHDSVVRAMPNAPGQIGAGITVWTATLAVVEHQRRGVSNVLAALGEEVAVPDEKLLDMATALSGSGPAYVFLFIEALTDAGVYMGMARDLAQRLAVQTVLGSSSMAKQSNKHPAQLRDMVTSPGGTTAEALLALEDRGFRSAVMHAVIAAYEKSMKLGEDTQK